MFTLRQYVRNSVWVIKLLYFFLYSAIAAWSSYFYVFLEDDRALTGTQIGLIAAVQQINNIIFLPLWGMVSDRYGKRKVFLMLIGISVVLLYGFMLNGSFWYYFLFMILFSALHNPVGALIDAFAINKSKEKYINSSYGQMRLWASVGWAFSSLLTGYLIESTSLSIIFVVASFFLLCTWLVTFFYVNKKREIRSTQAPSFKTLKNLLFGNKQLFYFFLIIMLFYILNSPTLNFINLYYKEIGASNTQIGYAFAVQALCELPFMFFSTHIINKFGIRRVLFATMVVASVRLMLYGFTTDPWVAISIGALHGITLGLFIVSVIEYTNYIVPQSQNSTGQTLMYTFLGVGMSVGNFLNGLWKDSFGLQYAMRIDSVLIIILLIAVYMVLFYRKGKQKIKMRAVRKKNV
ncbi:MAG: MFS transporter [Bacteroidota bacterium]